MTTLYEGRMIWGSVTATARDGFIFDGYSSGYTPAFIKANYCNGWVYSGTLRGIAGDVIGRYQNSFLYRGHRVSALNCIGRYQNGFIYKGTVCHPFDVVGRYKGLDDEGAALALCYLFKQQK